MKQKDTFGLIAKFDFKVFVEVVLGVKNKIIKLEIFALIFIATCITP